MASRRHPFAVAGSGLVLLLVFACASWTWSAFSRTAVNPANTFAAGTVTLTDNDAGSATFTLSGLKPGDTDSSCITVTSTGSVPSLVRLYGTTTGTGLDAHLDLVVTRGTSSGAFDDCTGFTADSTSWIGAGAGVVTRAPLPPSPTTGTRGWSTPSRRCPRRGRPARRTPTSSP